MQKHLLLTSCLLGAGCLLPGIAAAADVSNPPAPWGQVKLDLRLRSENVDQKGLAETAHANTLRTRLTYLSPAAKGFSGVFEIENVSVLGSARFNDTLNGKTQYPTVPDPSDTLINRAFIQYVLPSKQKITLGRQTFVIDNQRFVGTGGWRQNDQTLDGLSFEGPLSKNLSFKVAHIYQVNRTLGTRAPAGTWDDTNISLANLVWSVSPTIKATGYYYHLDIPDALAQSSVTAGVRIEARHKVSENTFVLVVDAARQKSLDGAPRAYDLPYFSVEPAITRGPWTVKYLRESVGSDGRSAVQFGLGSNHLFNGWADKFLTTPVNGLVDKAVTLQYAPVPAAKGIPSIRATLSYHSYEAYKGHTGYGTEWNALLEKDINPHLTLGIKFADYSADTFATDTRKIMPYVQVKY
ncbi:hypothetical protein PQU92_14280 [Asticcacaulis sp. BYS171W]|uniref:Alginate export domain-containing protein n=1 Tax=Asticcacaulis aquaticus TaxID=2984212 RepID=A0ABT5HWK4_9CAUL|nr:hypothetical protein [Asticcacaulis aquaticus]MDC7684450.1 hypothetical protein [Asticcacaulis aquaticus]